MANALRRPLQILLHQPHKQQIGEHHLRAGGGDGRAARRLLFGDSIQAVGRLLLQGVRAKPGDRQDLTADAQRFTGRQI